MGLCRGPQALGCDPDAIFFLEVPPSASQVIDSSLILLLEPGISNLNVRDGTMTMAVVATTWPGPMSATDGELASGSEEDEGGGRGPKHESGRRWQLLQRFLSSYEPTTPCSR